MRKQFVLLSVAAATAGCQSLSRQPANHTPQLEAEAIGLYATQNSLNLLEDEHQRLNRIVERGSSRYPQPPRQERNQEALDQLEARIRTTEQLLAQAKAGVNRNSTNSPLPTLSKLQYIHPWRWQEETFEVTDLQAYAFNASAPTRNYFVATQDTRVYDLALKQRATAENEKLDAQISCDHPFKLYKGNSSDDYEAGQVAQFRWEHQKKKPKHRVRITNSQARCVLKFRDSARSQVWSGVKLSPETDQFRDLVRLTRQFHVCSMPQSNQQTGPEKFFLTAEYSSITCPEYSSLKLLPRPIEGLTERIKALTGSELPQSVIDARNPYVELDFSRAPRLDVIVVSSLVFRSDFYGQLLAKALVWHANRGAIVRIINSKVLELTKDRVMFSKMMAASDNIKVQSYEYDSRRGTLGGKIKELHRVSHTKIFATYSHTQPEASVAIVGGRNVHEGYISAVAVDRLGFPELVDYLGGEDPFLYYRDVEAMVQSQNAAESIVAHYLTFWNRQPDAYIRSISLNLQSTSEVSTDYFASANQRPIVRHMLSLPYKDGRELMDIYADLIDSAEREIKITTPYFLPTKKLGKALERAVQRNVDVTVITKTDLRGDNPDFDFLTMAANQIGINRYWDKFKIFDYQVERSLLHSKLILIDGKLSIIGSVNMNRRSFYHDIENALMVYSPSFNQQLDAQFNEFLSLSKRVEGETKVGFLRRFLVGIINREL